MWRRNLFVCYGNLYHLILSLCVIIIISFQTFDCSFYSSFSYLFFFHFYVIIILMWWCSSQWPGLCRLNLLSKSIKKIDVLLLSCINKLEWILKLLMSCLVTGILMEKMMQPRNRHKMACWKLCSCLVEVVRVTHSLKSLVVLYWDRLVKEDTSQYLLSESIMDIKWDVGSSFI